MSETKDYAPLVAWLRSLADEFADEGEDAPARRAADAAYRIESDARRLEAAEVEAVLEETKDE